jgi:hypothetical protein
LNTRPLFLVSSLLAVALAWSAGLYGQVVTGQVIDSTSSMPVGTGFVVLLDQSDHEVARTLSASVGRFSLKAPRSGVYRLRSERIGYRAGVSQPFALTPDSALDYTLEVVPIPVVLAAVEVTGADVCHVHPDRARETALVWEEIRKALAATAWGTEQQVFRFSTYNYERDWDTRRDSVIAESGYTMEETASQSYHSLPAVQLADEGYVAAREDGDWYYLPDALTILDDAFLDTHCFSTVRDSLRHEGLVGLAFDPVADREMIDVGGVLWLDQESAQLRELDVRYTRLPESLNDERIGGTVEFMMLPTGAWIVRRWQLRMPKLDESAREILTEYGVIRYGQTFTMRGFHDVGGEVLRVATADGTSTYPDVSLRGAVLDSVTMHPLADVAVHLDGANVATRTDSVGWFRLSDLGFGAHALVFLKQGFRPRTYRFEVTGSGQEEIDVGLVGLSRGPAPVAEVSGTVTDLSSNEPVVGAMVSVNGQNVAVTGPDGTFLVPVTLRLGRNRVGLRRVGYRPVDAFVWVARDTSEFDLQVEFVPWPVELEEVVVEGERAIDFSARIRDFNRRRRTGLGKYFTREDIEKRRPLYVTDLLAPIPSVSVIPTTSGNNMVRMRGPWGLCKPAVFIDGIKLFQSTSKRHYTVRRLQSEYAPDQVMPEIVLELDIDLLVMPDEIAGMEVYRGPAETPAELGMLENNCGVIAIWTRSR